MSLKNLRYIVILGLFAVPFIPLYISSSLLFPFITGKAFLFRGIVEIIFACYLVLALKMPEYRPKFSWIMVSVFVFLIAIGLSDLISENPFKSFWSNYERMEGYLALLHFAAYFLVLTGVLQTKSLWNKFFATTVGISAIMAIYSFLQLAGKITINQGGVRVDGTFGNATYLGIYMVFNLFLAAYLFLQTKNNGGKLFLGAVALGDLIILYYTATRGAILGLLGGAFVAFIILAIKGEKGSKIRKSAYISIISIVTLVGAFLLIKDNPKVKNNPVLGRFATLSVSELKTQGRFYVWPIAWKGFLERPILGWGQESFNFVFNKYYDARMYTQEPWFDRTHDIALDWLIAGGLLGFLSYVFIFLTLLFTLWKKSSLSRAEKTVMFGLILAYVFHNFFVFDQIGSYILFFSILAFAHSVSSTETPEWAKKVSENSSKIFTNEEMFPVYASLVVILIALSFYLTEIIPIRENKNLMKALTANASGKLAPIEVYKEPLKSYNMGFPESLEHLSQFAIQVAGNSRIDPKFKQELFTTIDGAFKKELGVVPDDARYRLFYGFFLISFGNSSDALNQLNEASRLSPNKQSIYFEIGSNLLAAGKTKEALEVFRKAYELAPENVDARIIYGLGAIAVGDNVLAKEILSKVDPNRLLFDDRYISVLAAVKRFPEIIKIVQERVRRDPTNMQYRTTLAAALLQNGERESAVAVIEDMIKINPSFKTQGEYFIKEIRAGRNP